MELPYLIGRSINIYKRYGILKLFEAIRRYIELQLIDSAIYFRIKYLLKSKYNVRYLEYDYIADPLKIIQADPECIKLISEQPGIDKWKDTGKIRNGDWDLSNKYFDESYDLYRGFLNHFEKNIPWEDTDYYHRVIDQISSGRVQWGCQSEEEFRQRCTKLDNIYRDMQERGYLSQKELLKEKENNEPFVISGSHLEKFDEVAVDIGRDGEMLFVDGRNRLAMAKILNLEKIPVRVVSRHKEWQLIREKVGKHGIEIAPEYEGHPDLQDLV